MNLIRIKKDFENANIVWIGEVHGAIQNYTAHKELISTLYESGFKTIFWEMPADSSIYFPDGRFSSHSRAFLKWLELLKDKKHIELFLFDKRHTLSSTMSAQKKEDILATELLDKITDKSIIITGNFHSQLRNQLVENNTITPCAAIVKKQLAQFSFLIIGYSYHGGEIFNFGKVSIPTDYFAFNNKSAGDIYKNENPLRDEHYWINIGKASPIDPTEKNT
jgi:hypothetical protein